MSKPLYKLHSATHFLGKIILHFHLKNKVAQLICLNFKVQNWNRDVWFYMNNMIIFPNKKGCIVNKHDPLIEAHSKRKLAAVAPFDREFLLHSLSEGGGRLGSNPWKQWQVYLELLWNIWFSRFKAQRLLRDDCCFERGKLLWQYNL